MTETLDIHTSLSKAETEVRDIFSAMVRAWGSPAVARTESGRFSGGIANPRTLANNDSLGTGPVGRFRVGKKICYPAESLADWLRSRAKVIE